MKALSIRQPWAWLICAGYKDVENRTWKIHVPMEPMRIYVHAGKTLDRGTFNHVISSRHIPHEAQYATINNYMLNKAYFARSLGSIIGEVDIVDCRYRFGDEIDSIYSQWHDVGMYGFLLANPELYDEPIPCKGRLGFFTPELQP